MVTRSRGDILVTPADQRSFNFALTAPTLQDMAVHAEMLKNRSLIEAVVKKLGLDKKREDSQAKAAENPITAGLNQISVWIPWTSNSPTGAQKPAPEQSRMNSAVDSIADRPHDPGRAELEPARGAVSQQRPGAGAPKSSTRCSTCTATSTSSCGATRASSSSSRTSAISSSSR